MLRVKLLLTTATHRRSDDQQMMKTRRKDCRRRWIDGIDYAVFVRYAVLITIISVEPFITSVRAIADSVSWSERVRVGDRSTGIIATGDFDRDGVVDVAYSRNGGFQWYRGPRYDGDTDEFDIGAGFGTSYGGTAADMNNDGWIDLVASDGTLGSEDPGELYVFLNPGRTQAITEPWQRIVVYRFDDGTPRHPNDLVVHDMDSDGRLDIVVRSWTESKRFIIAFQDASIDEWTVRSIARPDGNRAEGMAVGDIDNDGRPEIIASGEFLDSDDNWRTGNVAGFTLDDAFLRQAVKTRVADLDNDGQDDDIVMAKAERQELIYIAWYKLVGDPADGASAWDRTILKDNVTNYHAIEVADFDGDGHSDVLAGTGFNGSQGIRIFYGEDNGRRWTESFVSTTEQLYVASVIDLDADGDLDIVGPQRWQNAVHAYYNQSGGTSPSDDQTPAAPSGLQAIALSERSVSLQWQDNANNETEFDIQRSTVGDDNFRTIASIPANVTAYTDSDTLFPDTAYAYRVLARNGNGVSTFSNIASVTTPAPPVTDITPPTRPTALRATQVGFNRIELDWGPSSDDIGVVQYNVYANGIRVVETTETRASIVNAQSDTNYVVEVSALDASDNESQRSASIQVMTPPRPSTSAALVAHWPLDQMSGDEVGETAGQFSGMVTGEPQWQPNSGQYAGALRFNGGADAVDVTGLNVGGTGVTLAAWIQPLSFADGANEGRIISKAAGSTEQQHFWMLSLFEDGSAVRFRLKTQNGETTTLVGPISTVALGQWSHVAATYDGDQMRVYVDGVEVASSSKSGDIATDVNVGVALGNQPEGVDTKPFVGLIDDVYVFDRAFDAAEIVAVMAGDELSQNPTDSARPMPPTNLRVVAPPQ